MVYTRYFFIMQNIKVTGMHSNTYTNNIIFISIGVKIMFYVGKNFESLFILPNIRNFFDAAMDYWSSFFSMYAWLVNDTEVYDFFSFEMLSSWNTFQFQLVMKGACAPTRILGVSKRTELYENRPSCFLTEEAVFVKNILFEILVSEYSEQSKMSRNLIFSSRPDVCVCVCGSDFQRLKPR